MICFVKTIFSHEIPFMIPSGQLTLIVLVLLFNVSTSWVFFDGTLQSSPVYDHPMDTITKHQPPSCTRLTRITVDRPPLNHLPSCLGVPRDTADRFGGAQLLKCLVVDPYELTHPNNNPNYLQKMLKTTNSHRVCKPTNSRNSI